MLEHLSSPMPDPILLLAQQFREDRRTSKIDLGIGVYRDERGQTPIMAAVKSAEQQLLETETTKAYPPLSGNDQFTESLLEIQFGADYPRDRIRGLQTPGGSAALRILFEMVKQANPAARVWISNPTWINHEPIVRAVGLAVSQYRYFSPTLQAVDTGGMMEDLANAAAGDIILLHGCCHNPTGVDMPIGLWEEISSLILKTGAIPLVDMAYQGFGDGLEADAAPLRLLANRVPELLLASSCSKNFGIYRERAGTAVVMAASARDAEAARDTLLNICRVSYSFPSSHGAAIVSRILADPALRAQWQSELEMMRLRLNANRDALAAALVANSRGTVAFDQIRRQRGMFSTLPISAENCALLRERDCLYVPGNGRVNVAGLTSENVDFVADAIVKVL